MLTLSKCQLFLNALVLIDERESEKSQASVDWGMSGAR